MDHQDHLNGILPWWVEQCTFHEVDTDVQLVIAVHHTRIVLYLSAESFADAPDIRDTYIRYLEALRENGSDGETEEDFHDWAAEPLLPLIRTVQPPDLQAARTLHDVFFPQTWTYTLRAGPQGILRPEPYVPDAMDVRVLEAVYLPRSLHSHCATFVPSEVHVCVCKRPFVQSPRRSASKVRLPDGRTAHFKLVLDVGSTATEISKYKAIDDAKLGPGLRTPQLLGVVADPEDGRGADMHRVFGLLLTPIDCDRFSNMYYASRAKKADKDNATALRQRQDWMAQVQATVDVLHEAGIAWGDVKPDNVLIDRGGDAWVVDFGGGCTRGWVPRELEGTIEGDLAGMAKMRAFVETGKDSNP